MRKWLLPLLLLLTAPAVMAQNNTTVTVNVTDAGGQTWNNGTYLFTFVGPGTASWPGGAIPQTFSGSLNGSGSVSGLSIPNNNSIQPQPTFWTLKVCPNPVVSAGPSGCSVLNSQSVTGASQTFNVTPPAISISVPTTPAPGLTPIIAYADAEISGGFIGFTYYNVTLSTTRICNALPCSSNWANAGGGGTSGSIVGTIPGAGSFNYIDPTAAAYGAKLDVKFATNAQFSFSSGGAVITCSACNPQAADVGKLIEAVSWNGNTNAYHSSSTLFPVGTISSVVAGTSFTVTGSTAAGNSTGTGVLMWGHDDTTAWGLAYTAAAMGNVCLTIQASGYSFVQAPIMNTTPTCMYGWSTTGSHYVGVRGGESSVLEFIPTTAFTTTSCPGSGPSYFFGVQGITLENVAVEGYGTNPSPDTTACAAIASQIDGTYLNIVVAGWRDNSANAIGFQFGTTNAAGAHMIQNISSSGTGTPCQVTGTANARNAIGNFCESDTTNSPMVVAAGGEWQGVTDDWQSDAAATSFVNNSGTFVEYNGQFSSNPATQSSFVSGKCGSYTALFSMEPMNNTGNIHSDVWAGASGCGGTPAILVLQGDRGIQGGSTGGAFFVAASPNNQIWDMGGNTITTPVFGTGDGSISQMFGSSLSISGVSLATSNVGLTSGWSTSTVATAVGDSHRGRFTITGAVGSSAPTLTLTFPTAYFLAPASCVLFETGANDLASLTSVVSAAASTTSVVFTFVGTPAAVTYQFDYECGP